MKELFLIDALAVPPAFVGPHNVNVIHWVSEHRDTFVSLGLKWVAASILFAAFWIAVMYFFGHPRDDD